MATGFGTKAFLGFAEESTLGTFVAANKFLEILEEKLALKQSWMSKDTLRSASRNQRVRSKKDIGGSFKFNLGFTGAERLIKAALGSQAAPSGSGPYVHIFSLADDLPTGLSIVVNRDAAAVGVGSMFKYFGCQIDKFTIRQSVEALMECEVSVVGMDNGNLNIVTPTFPTFEGIQWSYPTVTTLATVPFRMQGFELSVENTLAKDRYELGTPIRRGMGRSGSRKVTGKFKSEFDSLTTYAYFRDLSEPVGLSITVNNGMAGAAYREIQIQANAAISGDDPSVSSPGPLSIDYTFDAWQYLTGNDELSITLTNGTASP